MTKKVFNPFNNLPTKPWEVGSNMVALDADGKPYLVEGTPLFGKDIEIEWLQEPPTEVRVGDEYTISVKFKHETGGPVNIYFGLYNNRGYVAHSLVSHTHSTTGDATISNYGTQNTRYVRRNIQGLEEGEEVIVTATFKVRTAYVSVRWQPYVSFRNNTYNVANDPDGYTRETKTMRYRL